MITLWDCLIGLWGWVRLRTCSTFSNRCAQVKLANHPAAHSHGSMEPQRHVSLSPHSYNKQVFQPHHPVSLRSPIKVTSVEGG